MTQDLQNVQDILRIQFNLLDSLKAKDKERELFRHEPRNKAKLATTVHNLLASREDDAGPAPAAGFEAVPRFEENTPSTESDLSLSQWPVAETNYQATLRTMEIIQGFISTIRDKMNEGKAADDPEYLSKALLWATIDQDQRERRLEEALECLGMTKGE
jgi:hypothetical protein